MVTITHHFLSKSTIPESAIKAQAMFPSHQSSRWCRFILGLLFLVLAVPVNMPSPADPTSSVQEKGTPLKEQTPDINHSDTPIQGPSPLSKSLEQLTVVSMNIAGCQPSREAPRGWGHQDATKAIRKELLKTNPDILALQECPGGVVWASKCFPGYQALGATRSHMDQVVLLVREGIQAALAPIVFDTEEPLDHVPAIMAKLTHQDRQLLVASVHLAPFGEGKHERQMQMKALIRSAGSVPLIIAGDTNMRVAEDYVMEKHLHLVDVWKQSGAWNATKWTWDTKDHGSYFNRYYGDSTREYVARYDRIYASLLPASKLSVQSFELIANRPVANKFHFLSDHFGISTTFEIKWS